MIEAPVVWLHRDVPPPKLTAKSENIFFGFHDVTPWSPAGDELLGLRLPNSAQAMVDTVREARVCLWNPTSGDLRDIGSTHCWNFQQAARMQWVPGEAERVAFNFLRADGTCAAELLDIKSGKRSLADGGLYAIAPDGTWGLSPDFDVLSARWPAYGYLSLASSPAKHDPGQIGLWRNDLCSGERKLLISLSDVLRTGDDGGTGNKEIGASDQGEGHFLTHPSISPDGSKIVFLHRFFAQDGGSFTRLLACNTDGTNLAVLAEEKVSHFDWLDDQTLLVWARFAGSGLAKMRSRGALNAPLIRPFVNLARRFTGRWKRRILSESYFALKIDGSGTRTKFGWPVLDCDGHPMVARRHEWIVTDSYPDAKGELTLILWNRRTSQRVDVARLNNGVTSLDSDAKCDLHPRWNRDETQIAVDCCHEGLRRIAVFDVSGIVSAS